MSLDINQHLSELRRVMKEENLSAFIFPSTDAHNGEYIPEHWAGRKWISGFNGSAGTAVVTMDKAALWTDSRYFLAAADQLKGTEFVLMKEKLPETPSITQWLGMQLAHCDRAEVGLDGWVNSQSAVEAFVNELRHEGGVTVRTNIDPLARIWKDRPEIPENKVFVQPMKFAGETCSHKITRIREQLRSLHADGILVSALDDVAWTLNLRGNDVHCNPVFVAYLLIDSKKAVLYINRDKLTDEVETYLHEEGVSVNNYEDVVDGLKHYGEYSILLDTNETNYTLYNKVSCQEIIRHNSPIPAMKAIKNETEIAGYHRAMTRDGVAMVKFLKWLIPAVEKGGQTEISIDEKLTSLRADQDLFCGISFDTIAGYQSHGAIVHYEATPETDISLKSEGLLLLDSGAQYQDGTTDITRTIALGEVTEEQKRIYTLVLKGHIQLSMCKFPSGSSGTQLDILARNDMWKYGLNYLHGTGHGVGSFLNVHEGPHQFRMNWMPAPLLSNMTITDEPGIYLAGKFGCRTENTLLIVPYCEGEFGPFLQFEPLTLCPIDKHPIDISMMSEQEMTWFNDYHSVVYEKLSPFLDSDEKAWLKIATEPIFK
jgi:Xaa-Pro aminopeptidase